MVEYALDFAMPEGTPVFAAESGTVYLVINKYTKNSLNKSSANKSNRIIIKYKNEEYSDYAHLKKGIKVKKRDKVEKGQLIGYSGLTGYSTHPHLHFAILKFNKSTNSWRTIIPKFRKGSKIFSLQSPTISIKQFKNNLFF